MKTLNIIYKNLIQRIQRTINTETINKEDTNYRKHNIQKVTQQKN